MPDTPTLTRTRPKDLPAGYHLDHFREMLSFVERLYGGILGPAERGWIGDFRTLGVDAQSLFVRMANRKGSVFRTDRFDYTDVDDIDLRLDDLRAAGFVSPVREKDFAPALGILSKDEVFDLLAEFDAGEGVRRSWTKPNLLAAARERLEFEDCFGGLRGRDMAAQRRKRPLRYLLYLYFGRMTDGLTSFAMRDLGLVRTNSFKEEFEARFTEREEAEECFFYAERVAWLDRCEVRDWEGMVRAAPGWPPPREAAAPVRDTLLHALGRYLEKGGDAAGARALYALGASPECGEREVRMAWAAGEKDAARARLESMVAAPSSDGEALFAQDFLARKFGGKRTSLITDMLREAPTIGLDESHRATPERGAAAAFERQGWTAQHAENTPWRSLFGLLFWDTIYDGDTARLHNAFERMPGALRDGTFYGTHREAVEARLALLDDPDAAMAALLATVTERYGTLTPLFRWYPDMIERLRPLLYHAPRGAVATVLRAMAGDYRNRKDGFPDLILHKDGALRLVEIKAEGDQIRRNQLVQLELLREAGFDVGITRVAWIVDPEQTYVVVDIETTGGRAPFHRVTEIGAVKMRGGEIVDRWQSLVNPERPIPATITRLTGITNEMVADAPVFAEVADDFAEFMEEAVFVAHNVRFDYGFLSAEFGRLERRFRHPTLCTCQSMRKLWKGLPSYGLANLCRHFGIPLESHHRALCDAEAAAGLLLKINERRMASEPVYSERRSG